MKEATGELNMTVVVIIGAAILLSFFYAVLWPMIKNDQVDTSNCNKAVCGNKSNGDGTVDCKIPGSDEVIKCTWKG